MNERILHQGQFLTLKRRDHWEFVERTSGPAVVAIVAVTDSNELLLTDQYRHPVDERCIELPAGLVGDEAEFAEETLIEAAVRELEEETGYRAGKAKQILVGPASAGLSTEMIYFIHATDLKRVGDGGGDASEDIVPYAIAIDQLADWLADRADQGWLVDFKIYAALWLLSSNSRL